MKLIDLENHFFDQSAIDAFARRTTPPCYDKEKGLLRVAEGIMPMPFNMMMGPACEIAEKRLADMDRAGITTAVVSSTHGVEDLDAADSIEVSRKSNDTLYALSRKYPGRYLGSAILPVKDVKAAGDELRRCANELGFVAWHTHSCFNDGTSPDDSRYLPLLKTAAELGVYVYLHPNFPIDSNMRDLSPQIAGPWDFTTYTAKTLMRMIGLGVFDEIPNLKVVVGHLGEGLPYLLPRMDNRAGVVPDPNSKKKHTFTYYFQNNIWLTTSGYTSKEAFSCAAGILGIDRIIFGSDYPYEVVDDMTGFVLKDLDLTAEDREKLCFKNAEQLGVKA